MKFLKKFLWVVLLLAAGLSTVYLFLPDVAKYLELSFQDKTQSRRIEEEERKNVAYKKEINDLENNPVYIEKVAREKLGLSRPEEIIYKFKEAETKDIETAPAGSSAGASRTAAKKQQ